VKLPVPLDLAPMEAESREKLPEGDGWLYEPKWDGFRCVAFRDGDEIELRSKAGKPLTRYFPDVVDALGALPARRFVLDGEIVIPVEGALSFDDLLLRIHPAASRVAKLAAATPGVFIAFDLLVDSRGADRSGEPLRSRRKRLEDFAGRNLNDGGRVRLSPATEDVAGAQRWLDEAGRALDGVIAKRLDLPYQSGTRTGMVKVKRIRTADCVVGGFRRTRDGTGIASILLGLYDADGLLHHVGFCSAFDARRKREVADRLLPLRGGEGFTGRAPTAESRWRKAGSSADWEAVRPQLVVEVRYDHFTGGRFRHGTRFLRWRPDKPPTGCTLDQVVTAGKGQKWSL
jgi:ATP-dependent DNA ligase